MKIINDWATNKIIRRDKIQHFELLEERNCIKEVKDNYYCLVEPIEVCESIVLEEINLEIASTLNITDIDLEVKSFIKQLNEYNELKDIGETLVHKIAERKGLTSKQMFIEMEYEDLSIKYD
ncbi:DNA repair protein SWI5 like protein [Nosema granulosis]|uniref:DNA repair protein SWI5 like protein n=1 Tax=Nosema granulosis TaxID=83296 RepID=A0A9P6KZ41_9MICR|nr:DNA repair protein SWI5 like protein [Nosema granulosis]